MSILHRQLLEDHIVLSQCTGLIRQQVLDAAQLLRDSTIPGNCARHICIAVDAIAVEYFGQV